MGRQTLKARGHAGSASIALGLCFLALVGNARAEPEHLEETPTDGLVSIIAPTCETIAFSSGEFRRLLAIELAAAHLRLREPATQSPASSFELVLDVAASACQTDARDVVIALRADRNQADQRSVAVGDIAAVARTRALALAAAELIRESTRQWKEAIAPSPPVDVVPKPEELPKNAEKTPEPDDSSARKESPIVPALPTRRGDLALSPTWRFFTPSRTSIFGGRLSGTLPLAPGNPRLRADLGGAWASVSDPLGKVNLSILSGGIAALFATTNSPSMFVGPRVEIGYARGSGTARATGGVTPDRGGRALAAISLMGGLRAILGGRWSAFLELEVGGALGGLDVFADERTLAELHGPFFSAGAGISYAY